MTSIISPSEIAAHLGIPDSEDDATLATAAAAASQRVAEHCDREFVPTAILSASARKFRPERCHVDVDDFWETTALVVKIDSTDDGVYETTLTLNTDYYLEPINGRKNGHAWPYERIVLIDDIFPRAWSGRPSVQVTAAWGWTAVPAAVKQAALIEGAAIFGRKDSPAGMLGGFADFGAARVSRFTDPDVERYLSPFRRNVDKSIFIG